MAPTEQNGETRTTLAVLVARVEACQQHSSGERQRNHEEHTDMFDRLRTVETELAKQGTRLTMWATLGSIIGAALVQIVTKLLVK